MDWVRRKIISLVLVKNDISIPMDIFKTGRGSALELR
jgi:hypothetical protein